MENTCFLAVTDCDNLEFPSPRQSFEALEILDSIINSPTPDLRPPLFCRRLAEPHLESRQIARAKELNLRPKGLPSSPIIAIYAMCALDSVIF